MVAMMLTAIQIALMYFRFRNIDTLYRKIINKSNAAQ